MISGSMSSPSQAQSFHDRARAMSAEGHFEYAIELFLDALKLDPDNVIAHQELRDAGVRRAAAGGGDLSMLQKVKLRKPADSAVEDLLNTEKLLAYDPHNVSWLVAAVNHANRAQLPRAAQWLHRILDDATKR